MPRLHKYRDRNACYVLTAIRGAVVTFQLTPEGENKLTAAGITPDSRLEVLGAGFKTLKPLSVKSSNLL